METITSKTEQLRALYTTPYNLTGEEEFYGDFPYLYSPSELVSYRNSTAFRSTNLKWSKSIVRTSQVSGYMMGMSEGFIKSGEELTIGSYYNYYKTQFIKAQEMGEDRTTRRTSFGEAGPDENFSNYIERWAEYWADEHPAQIDLRTAVTEWFIHIIIQSYEGMIGELLVMEWLRERIEGLKRYAGIPASDEVTIEESSSEMDWFYNSDMVVKRNGELLFSIQVKPRSYLHNSNKYYQKEKDKHQIKDRQLHNRLGIRQYYIDKDSIIKQDYPVELILGESLVLHRMPHEDWVSIIEDGGEFRKIRVHRQTPPQYSGYPY